MDKIILEIKFYFFSTVRKITVGGFVNQLIKNSGLYKSKTKKIQHTINTYIHKNTHTHLDAIKIAQTKLKSLF